MDTEESHSWDMDREECYIDGMCTQECHIDRIWTQECHTDGIWIQECHTDIDTGVLPRQDMGTDVPPYPDRTWARRCLLSGENIGIRMLLI